MVSFTGVQHLCIFNIATPLIYHLLPNVWKASYTTSAFIFVDVPYWPTYSKDKFLLLYCTGSLAMVLSLWRRGRKRGLIGWVWWMLQNHPLPSAEDVHDSSSCVSPCIVMKNDGVLYHQVSSTSVEQWTKVVLQERAVEGRFYCLSWRYSVVQYYTINIICHNEHQLHNTLCRA